MSITTVDGTTAIVLPSKGKTYTYCLPEYLYGMNIIQWSLMPDKVLPYFNQKTIVEVMTNKGLEKLFHVPYIHGGWVDSDKRYFIPYGMNLEAEKWLTIRRNIQQDLWDKHAECHITYIKQIAFRGNGLKISKFGAYSYEDEDGDLIPDSIEGKLQFNMHAKGDMDSDGVSNLDQLINGSLEDPVKDDDGDGVSNAEELPLYYSNPFVADHTGTLANIVTVDVMTPVVKTGTWYNASNGILCATRRGAVEYDVNITSAGIYQLDLAVSQGFSHAKEMSGKVQLYVDGQFVRVNKVDLTYGKDTPSKYLTPYLSCGTHRIKLFYDNVYFGTSLQVNSIKLGQLGGTDEDGNGTADWLDSYLKNSCSMDSYSLNSRTSPAQIGGKGRYLNLKTVSNASVKRGTHNRWFSDVALSNEAATEVTVSWEGGLKTQTQTQAINWQQTNVAAGETITIRQGNSLLLNAQTEGTTSATITVEAQILDVTPEVAQAYQFTTAGTYNVTAQVVAESGAVQTCSMTVEVVGVQSVEAPWLWRHKDRQWKWEGFDSRVVLEATGMDFIKGESGYTLERNEILEDINIVARLGENGPIISTLPTKAFWVTDVVEGVIFITEEYEDGSMAVSDTMFGVNLPEGAVIKLTTNGAGIIFDDGSTVQNLTKADFDELDQHTVNMIKSATRGGSMCHTYYVYQNGVPVGWGHK